MYSLIYVNFLLFHFYIIHSINKIGFVVQLFTHHGGHSLQSRIHARVWAQIFQDMANETCGKTSMAKDMGRRRGEIILLRD